MLVRHGRTAWNAEGRAQGHHDVGLDEVGRAQAEQMAPVVAAYAPTLLLTSDLARARQTAEPLERATGLVARADERLREYDTGVRTG
ncbi:MAG: histidine phosphatase family protein, partial [Marmoricola sp.]|nr:histidine phosphatase family protein [Marmoricola sp.]